MKKFYLIAGLPGSGKDTVAAFLEKNDYFLMVYSKDVLRHFVERTNIFVRFSINKTIGNISENKINSIISYIENVKMRFSKPNQKRDLYITIAQYLNSIVNELTKGKYGHFSLFATPYYEDKEKIVVSGFREKTELDILKNLYPKAKIKTIYVDVYDKIRHKRMNRRDGFDMKTILENDQFEIETTHKKMIKEIDFNYVIDNNGSYEDLKENFKGIKA